jgi:hypothetical protein
VLESGDNIARPFVHQRREQIVDRTERHHHASSLSGMRGDAHRTSFRSA